MRSCLDCVVVGLVERMSSAQSVSVVGPRVFQGTISYSSVGADQGKPSCGRDDIEAMVRGATILCNKICMVLTKYSVLNNWQCCRDMCCYHYSTEETCHGLVHILTKNFIE